MPRGQPARHPSAKTPHARRLSRRNFLRDLTALSLTALAGSSVLEGCSPPPASPTTVPTTPPLIKPTASPETKPTAAAKTNSTSVLEALRNRKSATAFQTQPLPKEKLMELLWAAWGINRPEADKRTAPSAMNAQEIDLYVLLAEGAFVYDAKGNQLTLVVEQDLRSKAVTTGSLKDAPVQLVFVADYAKLRTTPSQRELWSAAHTGFIGQNVYLYCASEGLGARFYAGIDRAALKTSLKLRDDQAVIFGQAVGYPKA